MATIELKTELHQLIDKINDTDVLKAMGVLLSANSNNFKKDFWDELSDAEKTAIDEGLRDIENGKTTSYPEIRKEIRKKYKI